MKLTTFHHLLPRTRMVELCLHSFLHLYDTVLNYLNVGTTLPFCLYGKSGLKPHCTVDDDDDDDDSIQFNSLLFMCHVNSHKANYRHSTVQIKVNT
jgi:hypothetical protein